MNLLTAHQRLYERSGGRVGHRLIGLRFLLLRTRGRRTGQPRTAVLAYARAPAGAAAPGLAGADYLLVASNNGSDRPPGWLFNITADPHVEIQDGPRRTAATTRIVSPGNPEYERLWQVVNENNHGRYQRYQARTGRPIPVVVVTPAPPAAS